jgi:hypothetical protein
MPTAVTSVYNIDHHAKLTAPTPVACDTTGNTVPNGGNLILELTNTGASTYTVTVAANAVDGNTVTPITYSLTAGETAKVGGWPPSIYGGTLTFTASNAAVKYVAYTV